MLGLSSSQQTGEQLLDSKSTKLMYGSVISEIVQIQFLSKAITINEGIFSLFVVLSIKKFLPLAPQRKKLERIFVTTGLFAVFQSKWATSLAQSSL